jgi:hypothetical protein
MYLETAALGIIPNFLRIRDKRMRYLAVSNVRDNTEHLISCNLSLILFHELSNFNRNLRNFISVDLLFWNMSVVLRQRGFRRENSCKNAAPGDTVEVKCDQIICFRKILFLLCIRTES